MKKRKLIMLFLLVFTSFMLNVNAEEKLICPSEVEVGKTITCTYTFDTEERVIETDEKSLVIESISGNGNTQVNSYQALFASSGKIAFRAIKEGDTYVYVNTSDGSSKIDTLTNQIKITEVKKITTTTKKKSSNNNLSWIMINDKKVEGFSVNKTRYYVNVDNDIKKVSIKAEVEDDTAKYEIKGPKELEVGDNEYTIGVTSESDITKFYRIIITRKEEISSNANLEDIKVTGYKINFDRNSKTFHLTINNEDTKLKLKIKPAHKKASYEVIGNENLTKGSVIKIIVTAENNETETYRIIINKESKVNYLPFIIGGVILVIIVVIIIILVKKGKNNSKKEKVTTPQKKEDEIKEEIEKTIKMPIIDNDDSEKTKVLELDDEIGNIIDEELSKTLLFNNENKEWDYLSPFFIFSMLLKVIASVCSYLLFFGL